MLKQMTIWFFDLLNHKSKTVRISAYELKFVLMHITNIELFYIWVGLELFSLLFGWECMITTLAILTSHMHIIIWIVCKLWFEIEN